MTNRDLRKGRGGQKKKSIKAKTLLSSKRKLSRMGKEQKRGHAGESVLYVTRAQALRRLQLTLRDFRRLCILKGIHPRVPKKSLKGRHKTYYHIKDIAFLAHEPIINKFREFKTFMKKIRRAAGRFEDSEVLRKEQHAPTYKLDHIVRERYPTFEDAVRDLDDPLCMIYLFANLPAQGRVQSSRTAVCQRLCREWELYCVRARALRRVFVSIKGTYYQAEVGGEAVTWLVPHKFAQSLPNDVDFRVMLTFLEFYETLLKFVLFKLYADVGLRYPPRVDAAAEAEAVHLDAVRLRRAFGGGGAAAVAEGPDGGAAVAAAGKSRALTAEEQERVRSLHARLGDIARRDEQGQQEASAAREVALKAAGGDRAREAGDEVGLLDLEDDEDGEEGEEGGEGAPGGEDAEAMAALEQAVGDEEGAREMLRRQREERSFRRLFRGLRFFVSREVPREMLEFVIRAFGGRVGWEGPGSPFAEDDPRVTHHVVDRPQLRESREGREYVQPQWVFDSINARVRLPTAKYGVGATLPPHLSPFVDDAKEGYVPRYREELDRLRSAAARRLASVQAAAEGRADDEEVEDEDEVEAAFQRELKAERQGVSFEALEGARKAAEEEEEEEDDEEDDDDDEVDREDDDDDEDEEIGDEAARLAREEAERKRARKRQRAQAQEEERSELHGLAESMMSRKAKKLYVKMKESNDRKDSRAKRLMARRDALEVEEKQQRKRQRKRK